MAVVFRLVLMFVLALSSKLTIAASHNIKNNTYAQITVQN